MIVQYQILDKTLNNLDTAEERRERALALQTILQSGDLFH